MFSDFLGLSNNFLYGNFSELVTIAVKLAVSLATLLVEHKHLVALYEGAYYFAYYLCAFNCGRADADCAVFLDEENLVNSTVCPASADWR